VGYDKPAEGAAALENQEDFVRYLGTRCRKAEESVMKGLLHPPGREPWAGDIRRSKWFRSQSKENQRAIQDIVRLAIFSVVFDLLVELDGAGSLQGTPEEGMLELKYVEAGSEVALAGAGADFRAARSLLGIS
jgi:hypothetical protein